MTPNVFTRLRAAGGVVRADLDDVHRALNDAVLTLTIAAIDRTHPQRRDLQTALGLLRSVRAMLDDIPPHRGPDVVTKNVTTIYPELPRRTIILRGKNHDAS